METAGKAVVSLGQDSTERSYQCTYIKIFIMQHKYSTLSIPYAWTAKGVAFLYHLQSRNVCRSLIPCRLSRKECLSDAD